MINRYELSSEQIKYAIENAEFGTEVTASKNTVVVIMTQDWCPQWRNMNSWVYKLDIAEDIDIYELQYNKTDYFKEFMNMKETRWKNELIPYLRYYKNGVLYRETNYVNEEKFREILGVQV